MPFFTGCILYNFFPGHMGAAGPAVLRFLVFAGALLQVLPACAYACQFSDVIPSACNLEKPGDR